MTWEGSEFEEDILEYPGEASGEDRDRRDFVTDLFDPDWDTSGLADGEKEGGKDLGVAEKMTDSGSPLSILMSNLKSYRLLTREEEFALAEKVQRGSEEEKKEARELLINSNTRLVISVAKDRFLNKGVDIDDLVSAGVEGLGKAVDKFDPSYGVRLSTFAAYDIRKAMSRAIFALGGVIRLPEDVHLKIQNIKRAEDLFRMKNGRDPSEAELSEACGIGVDEIRELFTYRDEMNTVSLESPLSEDERLTQMDRLPSDDDSLKVMKAEALIAKYLDDLDERSRKIVVSYYGFFGGEKMTDEKIAGEMGIKKQRVNQIRKAAMKKLTEKGLVDELLALKQD